MAGVRKLFYVVAILASAHSILAEEGSGQPDSGPPNHHHQHDDGSNHGRQNPFGSMMDGFSSFGTLGGSNSNPSGSNPSQQNPFGSMMDGFSSFGNLGGSDGNPSSSQGNQNPLGSMMNGFPSFGNLGGAGGNPFSGFASAFGIPSFPGFGSRQGEGPHHPHLDVDFQMGGGEPAEVALNEEQEEESEEEPESRLFFSSFLNTRLRTCNYTTQPGASCASCREVLRCRPNNVGTVKRCGFLFSYCNNGRCSLFPGALCNPTTVAADTTTVAATTVAATTAAPTTVAPTTV